MDNDEKAKKGKNEDPLEMFGDIFKESTMMVILKAVVPPILVLSVVIAILTLLGSPAWLTAIVCILVFFR